MVIGDQDETAPYFLADRTLVALVDEMFDQAHDLEALWARLKRSGPRGDEESEGIAKLDTGVFFLKERCQSILRELETLTRQLPAEDEPQ